MSKVKKAERHSQWFLISGFFFLVIIFFGRFLTSDVILVGSDHSPDVFFSKVPLTKLKTYFHPPNWSSRLGGTAVSDRRIGERYFPLYFLRYLIPFYKALGWSYILIAIGAGVFMFLYLRAIGIRRNIAFLVGVCYMFAPTFMTFTFAGHYAKMEVIALTPLFFLAVEKGVETGRSRYFLLSAGTLALEIYTNHIQMAYFSAWGVVAYFIFKLWQIYRREGKLKVLFRRSAFALSFVLGIGIGAMNLFPPYFHTKTVSKRALIGRTYEYASSWSLHPEEMASLLVPEFGGYLDTYWGRNYFKLNSEYMGLLPLWLGLLGLIVCWRDPKTKFFFGLFLVTMAYALGPHTPVHRLFYHLVPGVKSLRAPGMIAFLGLFSCCVLAAMGLEDLRKVRKNVLLCLWAISAGTGFLLLVAPGTVTSLWRALLYPDIPSQKLEVLRRSLPHIRIGGLWAMLLSSGLFYVLYLWWKGRLKENLALALIVPIVLADTWRVDKRFLNYQEAYRYRIMYRAKQKLAEFFKGHPGRYRVLPISRQSRFSIPGVDIATGFDDFMNRWYYVIIRPENLRYKPIINLLNIRYIVTESPIEGLSPVYSYGGYYVYENPDACPFFYLAKRYVVIDDEKEILEFLRKKGNCRTVVLDKPPHVPADSLGGGDWSKDKVIEEGYDPEKGYIKLKTYSQGWRFLVVSENYHPNWKAYVDGEQVPVFRADYAWKGIFVLPGVHDIEFIYSSEALTWRLISLLSVIGFGGSFIFLFLKRKGV